MNYFHCIVCFYYGSGQGDTKDPEVSSSTPSPCEATNKEAFFSRVQSYSISFRCSKMTVLWMMSVVIVSEFLSPALFEMGRQAPRALPSHVRPLRLDQHRPRHAQVLQLPRLPLRVAPTHVGR